MIQREGAIIRTEPTRQAELRDAQVSFSCATCGRSVRVTLRQMLEGRSCRCPAGHRIEMDTGEGWFRREAG